MEKTFYNMHKDLEERTSGNVKLEKYHPKGFMAMYNGIPEGDYIRLIVDGTLMMSNTPMEQRTSMPFVANASGDVLICGLGLGMVILPLLDCEEVTSITVIENSVDVVKCVYDQIKSHDKEDKLRLIIQDAFKFETLDRYDCIFVDIWPAINSDIYKEEMKPLKDKYRRFLKPSCRNNKHIFVWAEHEARYDQPLR